MLTGRAREPCFACQAFPAAHSHCTLELGIKSHVPQPWAHLHGIGLWSEGSRLSGLGVARVVSVGVPASLSLSWGGSLAVTSQCPFWALVLFVALDGNSSFGGPAILCILCLEMHLLRPCFASSLLSLFFVLKCWCKSGEAAVGSGWLVVIEPVLLFSR